MAVRHAHALFVTFSPSSCGEAWKDQTPMAGPFRAFVRNLRQSRFRGPWELQPPTGKLREWPVIRLPANIGRLCSISAPSRSFFRPLESKQPIVGDSDRRGVTRKPNDP